MRILMKRIYEKEIATGIEQSFRSNLVKVHGAEVSASYSRDDWRCSWWENDSRGEADKYCTLRSANASECCVEMRKSHHRGKKYREFAYKKEYKIKIEEEMLLVTTNGQRMYPWKDLLILYTVEGCNEQCRRRRLITSISLRRKQSNGLSLNTF